MTIIGYTVFKWMLPAVCILLVINTFFKNKTICNVAVKIITLGLALMLVVPVSVRLSTLIEDTYKVSMEIESSEFSNVPETEESAMETETEKAVEKEVYTILI